MKSSHRAFRGTDRDSKRFRLGESTPCARGLAHRARGAGVAGGAGRGRGATGGVWSEMEGSRWFPDPKMTLTLPKTNMDPENGSLEDEFPLQTSQGPC